MTNTCIFLSITTYEDGSHYARCRYQRWTNNQLVKSYAMELPEALDMMWTLKKLGGKKTMAINRFNHTICTRSVSLFMNA